MNSLRGNIKSFTYYLENFKRTQGRTVSWTRFTQHSASTVFNARPILSHFYSCPQPLVDYFEANPRLYFSSYVNNSIVIVQSLSHVWLFVTPRTATHQAPLSSTISPSLLKFMSNDSVKLFNHLVLCHTLLLLPSVHISNGYSFKTYP